MAVRLLVDCVMRFLASTVLFLLVACGSDSAKTAEPKNELPVEQPVEEGEATPVEATPVEATPVEEADTASNDECIKECVAARQMQATSIETIELDCTKKCSGDEDSAIK